MRLLTAMNLRLQRLLLTLLLPLVAVTTFAYDFEVDGICYNWIYDEEGINTQTVEVTRRLGGYYSGDIIIPAIVLTENDVQADVVRIGNVAFSTCPSLTSIVLPESITSIGTRAFLDCHSLTSVVLPEGITSIGEGAFQGCYNLSSINIPSGVTSIEDLTFFTCTSLTSQVLHEGITSIGSGAFEYCISLSSINIPSSVTSIGEGAFSLCKSLSTVIIPSNVLSIGEGAFSGCDNLQAIEVDEANLNYKSKDGVLFTKDMTELMQYPVGHPSNSYVIPDGVTSIDANAFSYCRFLISIIIPNSVNYISPLAFSDCSSIVSVTNLADTPQNISEYSFSKKNIATLHVKHGLHTTYGSAPVWQDFATIIDNADGNPTPTELPDNFVYDGLFYNKVSDNTVEVVPVPEEVENYWYFGDITIPDIVLTAFPVVGIGNNAFKLSVITSIVIPDGITSIGEHAFAHCYNLPSINIPSGVTRIEEGTFSCCFDLSTLVLPDGITSIGSGAFQYCRSLSSINIPSGVTRIETYTFDGCSSLTSVVLPEGITSIGERAFRTCEQLETVNIPSGVTSIEKYTFWDCSSLTSVVLPERITSIGDGAFSGCTSLASINIPSGVTSIGVSAFRYCDALTDVTNLADNPQQIAEHTFSNYDATIHVKKGLRDTYASAPAWEKFTTILDDAGDDPTPAELPDFFEYNGLYYNKVSETTVEVAPVPEGVENYSGDIVVPEKTVWEGIEADVVGIGEEAFMSCVNLTSVNLHDGIASIGTAAFFGCSSLTSIVIPEGITELNETFTGCINLSEVSLPQSLVIIGYNAFLNCPKLASIEIPYNVTEIRDWAFDYCESLTSIIIPANVTYIGEHAFEDCTSLADVTNLADTPQEIAENVFSNYDATLHVKEGLKDVYKEAPVWQNFYQIVDDTPNPEPYVEVDLDEPGTLENEIWYPEVVERLTITGAINGTDVNFIRTKLPALEVLNLERAWVVEGGSAYHSTYTAEPLYTTDYTIGDYMFSEMPKLDILALCSNTNNIGKGIIAGSGIALSIEIPEQVKSVAEGALDGIDGIMVQWNADNAVVPDNVSDNPNLIIYATENYKGNVSRENLVVGKVAENIVLHEGYNLFIAEPFRAKQASYTRTFSKQTQRGTAAGWESIILPFDATKIVSEQKGRIAPFGSEQSGNARFYLAELQQDGFALTSELSANKPYIICMPNSPEYADQYNITGRVMFSAASASGIRVMSTYDAQFVESQNFSFVPSYAKVNARDDIYVLNEEVFDGFLPGSVFIPGIDVQPFHPYVVDNINAPAYIPVFEGDVTAIMPILDVKPSSTDDAVYDLMGIRQDPDRLVPGKVYIINGVKVKR